MTDAVCLQGVAVCFHADQLLLLFVSRQHALTVFYWPTPEGLDTLFTPFSLLQAKLRHLRLPWSKSKCNICMHRSTSFCTKRSQKDTILGACRSYRLCIVAVRDPASANSVQLAKLDLYTPLDPPSQPQRPILEAVKALQAAVSTAADSKPDSAMAKAVDTLLLVLANVLQHPGDSKFRTLKLENAKIKAMMLAVPEVGQVLSAAGQSDLTAGLQGMYTK